MPLRVAWVTVTANGVKWKARVRKARGPTKVDGIPGLLEKGR